MTKKDETKQVKAEVRLVVPTELAEGRYSNYATIGHSEDAFHILFGQTMPPSKVPVDKTIVAQAVAHIIVSPTVMPKFIKAISDNYERYKKTFLKANYTKREKK